MMRRVSGKRWDTLRACNSSMSVEPSDRSSAGSQWRLLQRTKTQSPPRTFPHPRMDIMYLVSSFSMRPLVPLGTRIQQMQRNGGLLNVIDFQNHRNALCNARASLGMCCQRKTCTSRVLAGKRVRNRSCFSFGLSVSFKPV